MLLTVAGAGRAAPPYRDGPPLGFSGGFGEDSCQACHFEFDLNEPPGRLTLEGVPERYAPGAPYELTVTLVRPGVPAGGFMLTARREPDGAQAGALSVPASEEGRVSVDADDATGVLYAYHRLAGSEPIAADTLRWAVLWTAPETDGGPVVVHVAAGAANGDDTSDGDYVYTASARSAPGHAP
ncbi:MAG TPA: choice-of-anchor V domain-containing protein [Longimicrobiales bacterium]|nr:choice-of-anchor V domain-containing protein [Longimicrobiales bacterium]